MLLTLYKPIQNLLNIQFHLPLAEESFHADQSDQSGQPQEAEGGKHDALVTECGKDLEGDGGGQVDGETRWVLEVHAEDFAKVHLQFAVFVGATDVEFDVNLEGEREWGDVTITTSFNNRDKRFNNFTMVI